MLQQYQQPSELSKAIKQFRNAHADASVGFVPTMGALHKGHISLIEQSLSENALTVCSIFVNPLQFNNAQDFEKYPLTLEADLKALQAAGCHMVFTPSKELLYPVKPELSMHFGKIESTLEGAFRPGHFSGVGVVVSKLFHFVQPDRAYFGLKDLQQCAVIRQMVKDLSFPIELRFCQTSREQDGLAMSSRNVRLSSGSRAMAPAIYQSLLLVKEILRQTGQLDIALESGREALKNQEVFQLEYMEVIDYETFEIVTQADQSQKKAVCVAAYLEGVRLIDNLLLDSLS